MCCRNPILVLATLLATAASSFAAERQVLRAALFPYLPDAHGDSFEALAAKIESDFEKENADVDLDLRPLDPINDDFYDACAVTTWLRTKDRAKGYDVVEVDSVILEELVGNDALQAWSKVDDTDWHPAAKTATRIDGRPYGIPHWLCGYFTFSRDEAVANAGKSSELVRRLRRSPSPLPNVVGDLVGSWELPMIYLDAWADTRGTSGIRKAVSTKLEGKVVETLKRIADECRNDQGNPCLDGPYDDNDVAPTLFGGCKADALIGYSERLHHVLKAQAKGNEKDACSATVHLGSAPLGQGDHPILFVDSFVLSKRCESDACRGAARRFVDYMNAPRTFEWISLAREQAAKAFPRYLLPALRSAYGTDIGQDPYYLKLDALTRDAPSYPNGGILIKRRRMSEQLLEALGKAPQP